MTNPWGRYSSHHFTKKLRYCALAVLHRSSINKLKPPPRRSPQTHALHLTMASWQHHMHKNPQQKKMPKRETNWFERGAWGIWVWVWVWAKSRDKESSRKLSTKIEGERRKRRRKKEEKERMEAEKLRNWETDLGKKKKKKKKKKEENKKEKETTSTVEIREF